MRCLALAEEFRDRGWDVVIAADLTSVPFALTQVERRGLPWIQPPVTAAQHHDVVRDLGVQVAVIDSYVLDGDVYRAVRNAVPVLVAMTDGDTADRSADLYVDQNIGAESDQRPVPDGARRLAGLRYALLREGILRRRPERPREDVREVPEVLAVFGGTDSYGAAPVLSRCLVETGRPFRLTVVAGDRKLAGPLAEVAARARPGQQVEVCPPIDGLEQRVVDSDLVVSASGTSTWEFLALGTACALVAVVDNQDEGCRRVTEQRLAVGLGRLQQVRDAPETAITTLSELLASPDAIRELRTRAWAAVDGGGRARVVDEVVTMANNRAAS